MQTPDELLQKTIQNVESILGEHFPEYVSFGDGSFTISRGSATVMLVVRSFTEEDTVVECIANLVVGATISSELMQFLLRKNSELHFGGFGLLFDNTITYSNSISGKNMDANELINLVDAVSIIADHYDDEIISMAGGTLAKDAGIVDLEA